MRYKHLNYQKRCQILAFWKAGYTQRKIAKEIGVHESCPGSVFTITSDNGSEFAYHENISKELNTEFYFAHPYSSWERGLNENTNGLVRQYLKKGCSFTGVTDDHLASISDQLNNRPRRSLGYASPNEIFYEGNESLAYK
ncbi:MAG: IS30 family transposase [Pseudomonadota bacterium]